MSETTRESSSWRTAPWWRPRLVDFVVERGAVRIVKARTGRRPTRGAAALATLRRHSGRVSMTTDEIMALTRGDA